MKKLFMITGFSGMVWLQVQTQPVIDFDGFITLQDKIILKTAPLLTFIGLGEDITWNFSGLNPYDSDTLEFVNLDSACDGAFLPGGSMHGVYQYSNFSYILSKTQEIRNFYISSEGFFSEGGGVCEDEFTVFTDMKQLMSFPFTYFSYCFDNYDGSIVNQPGTDFSGNIVSQVAGYGTLILPNMTFNNVLLLLSEDIRQLPSGESDTTKKACFFEPSIPYPVLEITNLTEWVYFDDLLSSLNNYQKRESQIIIFPNPAKDYIQFEVHSSKFAVGDLWLFDLFGIQVARKEIISEQTMLDVSELPGGVYFYRVVLGEITDSGKILIQK
ncbi:MAG: T9SS type A sorting domain-containing protein [Bacteroidales bacterium]